MVEPEDELRSETSPGEPASAAPEGDELDRLRTELDKANRKGQEDLSLLQRVQADFVNFRRRVDQEREERSKFAKGDLILKILSVLDDFERALKAMPDDQRNTDLGQGIALIERKLRGVLESEGVTRFEAIGLPFNPWEHEAVLYEETPATESGTVVNVVREGYRLHDRVLRPAQVGVAK